MSENDACREHKPVEPYSLASLVVAARADYLGHAPPSPLQITISCDEPNAAVQMRTPDAQYLVFFPYHDGSTVVEVGQPFSIRIRRPLSRKAKQQAHWRNQKRRQRRKIPPGRPCSLCGRAIPYSGRGRPLVTCYPACGDEAG